jgi:dsRNA-specific ribonuclease
MTPQPNEPPPALRLDLSPGERSAIAAVVGPLPDELARIVRDGRGAQFQRLEFLGDSVLDLVMNVHAVAEPGCQICLSVQGDVARLVTDHRLSKLAVASGVGSWLEWEASPERLADLIETCIAAAWLHGSWKQTTEFIGRVIHPIGEACERALTRSADPSLTATGSRAERRMGAALLELATARAVFVEDLTADEGELSSRRAMLHRTSSVAAYAKSAAVVSPVGGDAAVADRVDAWLAAKLLSDGADAALLAAGRVIGGAPTSKSDSA